MGGSVAALVGLAALSPRPSACRRGRRPRPPSMAAHLGPQPLGGFSCPRAGTLLAGRLRWLAARASCRLPRLGSVVVGRGSNLPRSSAVVRAKLWPPLARASPPLATSPTALFGDRCCPSSGAPQCRAVRQSAAGGPLKCGRGSPGSRPCRRSHPPARPPSPGMRSPSRRLRRSMPVLSTCGSRMPRRRRRRRGTRPRLGGRAFVGSALGLRRSSRAGVGFL